MASIAPTIAFVFRPNGTAGNNVYTDWPSLMAQLDSVEGRKILEFDDSTDSNAVGPPCEIPEGTWNMRDVVWAGYGPRARATRSVVAIKEGAILKELRMISGQITIDNQANTISPISDFVDGPGGSNHIQIGMRDDCGNTQIFNSGNAPLFDLGTGIINANGDSSRAVFFFAQNSLLGIRLRDPNFPPGTTRPDPNPLITHTNVDCVINFIGQNQTGNNLLTPGAKAVFGALSSSTQIGTRNISVDGEFAPVTRIQRKVQPQPPSPPATYQGDPLDVSPLNPGEIRTIDLPNVLLRCDGQNDFLLSLPNIQRGFSFARQDQTFLYTGGQEIVVAEVAGGEGLRVQAATGDMIDGSTDAVRIKAHEARVLASDGERNWITIASDLQRPSPPGLHFSVRMIQEDDVTINIGGGQAQREFLFDLLGQPGPCVLFLNLQQIPSWYPFGQESFRISVNGIRQISGVVRTDSVQSIHQTLTPSILKEAGNVLKIEVLGDVPLFPPEISVSDVFVMYESVPRFAPFADAAAQPNPVISPV